jgi:hypothetical protein
MSKKTKLSLTMAIMRQRLAETSEAPPRSNMP